VSFGFSVPAWNARVEGVAASTNGNSLVLIYSVYALPTDLPIVLTTFLFPSITSDRLVRTYFLATSTASLWEVQFL
jgi:hypothetical protein